MELWVHNCMAPDVRTAVVLVSQSRLLVVRLSIGLGEVCCVVLHAPDAVAGEAAIRAWWRASLAALRRVLPGGVPVLLFADANGRVGAQASLSVGCAEADEVDVGGEELQDAQPCAAEHLSWRRAYVAASQRAALAHRLRGGAGSLGSGCHWRHS